MDIRDFQGITKFKFIIPTFYVISWFCMIFGPTFFQSTYVKICVLFVIYADIKLIMLFVIMVIVSIKGHRILTKYQQSQLSSEMGNRQHIDTSQEIYYAFVLPNYKEDI